MASYRERIIRKAATLIGSVLLMGSVLATSAYAWFSAQRQVSMTGTEIVVSDNGGAVDFSLFYYNGNFDGRSLDADPHGYLSVSSFSGGFVDNFTRVTGNDSHQTSSAGLYPGRRLTYALELINGAETKDVTIQIGSFLSKAGRAYKANSQEPILLSYAIDVHCDYCSLSELGENLGDYLGNEYFPELSHEAQSENGVAKDMFNVSTQNPGVVTLIQNVEVGATPVYVFFTVIFSNAPSTYYRFVNTVETEDYSRDYYLSDSENGNSNCYMDLGFQITEMMVS